MKIRPRINRWTATRRNLLFDGSLLSSLVQPHFVVEGSGINEPIEGMPGINQQSVDTLIETVKEDARHGIHAVMLFGVVAKNTKTVWLLMPTKLPPTFIEQLLKSKQHSGMKSL